MKIRIITIIVIYTNAIVIIKTKGQSKLTDYTSWTTISRATMNLSAGFLIDFDFIYGLIAQQLFVGNLFTVLRGGEDFSVTSHFFRKKIGNGIEKRRRDMLNFFGKFFI